MEEFSASSRPQAARCPMCAGPVTENTTPIETADGSVLEVCPECATRFGCLSFDKADDRPEGMGSFEQAMDVLTTLIDHKEDETAALKALSAFLVSLSSEMTRLENLVIERDDRMRTFEAECERLRERLCKAEALLVTQQPAATFEETPAYPGVAGAAASSSYPPPAVEFPLSLEALRLIDRLYNGSEYVEKMGAVRRGLGHPVVNITPLSGEGDRVLVTIAWEIVWYQFLVDLAQDTAPNERLLLFGEGMELEEISPHLRESNAAMDGQGRLDVSELELKLAAGGPDLLTELSDDRAAALDDATEEIWNQQDRPEFRWKD